MPAGAAMVGRLMRVETKWWSPWSPAQVTFALRWETVEVDRTPMPIRLNPNRRVQPRRANQGEERYYVYQIKGEQGVLDTGSRSEWITASR